MKKSLVFILVLCFCFSMVFLGISCKEPEVITETVVETITETVVETVEVEAQEEEKELTELTYYSPTHAEIPLTFYNDRITAFMEANPDIIIRLPQEAQSIFYDKVTMLASIDELDELTHYWGPGGIGSVPQSGLETGTIQDWMPFLDADPEWKAVFNPTALAEQTNDKGQIAVLPCPSQSMVMGLFVNTKILRQYNLEIPTEWDQWMDTCQVLKDNGVTPIAYFTKDPWGHWAYEIVFRMYDTGPYAWDTMKKIVAGEEKWNNPDYLKAAQRLQEIVDNGFMNPNLPQVTCGEAFEMFEKGQAAFVGAGLWMATPWEEALGADNIEFLAVPVPSDANWTEPLVEVTFSEGMMLGSKATGKKQDAALKWAKFLSTKESAQMALEADKPPAFNYDLDYTNIGSLLTQILTFSDKGVPMQFQGQFGPTGGVLTSFYEEFGNLMAGLSTPEEFLDNMDAAQQRAFVEAGQ